MNQKQLDVVQLSEFEMEKAYRAVLQKISRHFDFEDVDRKENDVLKQKHIRELMVKGYEEMSQINLTICSECLHAEYEASHVIDRIL